MHTVAADRECDIDAVVDDQRHRAKRYFDGAGALDHDARIGQLVAQLHQGRAAGREHPAQIGKLVAAGNLRIDDGITTQIDAHQLTLDRDDFSSNRHPALAPLLSMIFSENRFTLFGSML